MTVQTLIESKCSVYWQPEAIIRIPWIRGPMSQTVQQPMTLRSPTFAITPSDVPIPISQWRHAVWTGILFCAIAVEDSLARTN